MEILLEKLKKNEDLRQTLSAIRKLIKEDSGAADIFLRDKEAIEALVKCLGCEDAKTRKSATLLIGELGLSNQDEYREKLLSAYESETTLFVRECYLKALAEGKEELTAEEMERLSERLSYIDSHEFPESDMKHIIAERKALVALIGEGEREKAVFREPENLPVLMVPAKDFYDPLKKALADRGITKGISSIGVLLRGNDFERVKDLRIYDHLKYMIPGDFSLAADSLRDEIEHSILLPTIEKLYKGNVSIRVYLHQKEEKNANQIKRLSGELMRLSGGKLLNEAPYDAELHFYRKKSGGYSLFLRPLTEDRRFLYDINRLSTSMQPVKAAVMVSLLDEYLESYSRVVDLFAGNGTLLMERDEALRTKVMFAVDTSEESVKAGRENSKAKGRTVNFVHRSAFTFESEEPFDEIISELPDLYEKSSTDRREFFEKLGAETKKILRRGGKAFYLTSEENEIKAMIRKTDGIDFLNEMQFDEKRSIFVLEKKA
jgi:SAM-dependent methyltransferase